MAVRKVVARQTPRRRRARRVRRTAEEARRAILVAAERRLIDGGPEAIRLQEIAADVGLSHPAILHHFGSRDGLIEALVEHAMRGLQQDLIGLLLHRRRAVGRSLKGRIERTSEMFERTFQMLADRGYARLLAWLVLSGRDLRPLARGLFAGFPQVAHQARVQRRLAEGRHAPELEDTLFGSTLVMVTLLGDALFGRLARLGLGLPDDADTRRRFRRWTAGLAERYEPAPPRARSRE